MVQRKTAGKMATATLVNIAPSVQVPTSNNRMQPFLKKLKLIIETVPPEIAGWDETGTVFEVLDVKAFAEELKKHYKGSQQTFIRQLHFYCFTKSDCTRNLRNVKNLPPALPGAWSFSHPFMVRHAPELMAGIQRHDKREVEESENEEINQLRQQVKSLEKTVAGLSNKLSLLITAMERQGLDTGSDSNSSKPSAVESERISRVVSNKRPRLEEDEQEDAETGSFMSESVDTPKDSFFFTEPSQPYPGLEPIDLQRNVSSQSFVQMEFNEEELAESLSHGMSFDNELAPLVHAFEESQAESKMRQESTPSTPAPSLPQTPVPATPSSDIYVDPASVAKIILHLRAAITAAAASPTSTTNSQSMSILKAPKQSTPDPKLDMKTDSKTPLSAQELSSLLPLLLALPQIQSALSTISTASPSIGHELLQRDVSLIQAV